MTRIVVCDTGPLLHLSEAGAQGNRGIVPVIVPEMKRK
jgi:hypothetical protein